MSGKFNENLPAYGEDLDFAFRLWKKYPEGLFYSKTINVYMHNVKTIDEALSDYYQYGQYNVPLIIKRYPELAPYVAADFITSTNEWSWQNIIGIFLINPIIYHLVKWILYITPFPLSNLSVRYLLVASIAMGYRRHLKSVN